MTHMLTAKEQPLGKIFSDDYMFSIPDYQRPYSWGKEQAQELLEDLLGYMRGVEGKLEDIPPYFLGSLVLIKKESLPQAEVVDGQQRLTTLTLLLACIRAVTADPEMRAGITACIYQKGNIVAATQNSYRLSLRERDRDFFREMVQHEGGIEKLVEGEDVLPDSRQRLRENARYFMSALQGVSQEMLLRLVQFIVTRCFLVAVATPDLESAYRIFGVMNSRGLDLTATDILKADIIGKLPEVDRKTYTDKWEALEGDLGRDAFGDLFSHIRMIYRKAKPGSTLLKEFKQHVPMDSTKALMDEVLVPMAEAFSSIRDAQYATTRNADAINEALRWLNRLEFNDWVPPALRFFTRHKTNPDALQSFVVGLERSAFSMLIRKAGINERIERFSRLTQEIEDGADLKAAGSALQLSPKEQFDTYAALDGPLYQTHAARALGLILLRLDAMASDGSKTMFHQRVTVEHVLPQTPKAGSDWVSWIPSEHERRQWVHRLGNLALLNRTKNSAASNYDFEKKKNVYLGKGGVCPFPLTTQVLQKTQWSLDELRLRQDALLAMAEGHWQLEGRAAPDFLIGSARSAVGSPVFEINGMESQLHAKGRFIDGQFVVLAGSRARADWIGVEGGYQVLHHDLIESGMLAPAVGLFREFLRDTAFSSPSAASAVVWGRSDNGRTSWTLPDTGQTLAEWDAGEDVDDADDADDECVHVGERAGQFLQFWSGFLAKANAKGALFVRRTAAPRPSLGTGLGRAGFRLNVALTRNNARVTCLLPHGAEGVSPFDRLLEQRQAIEAELGQLLEWDARAAGKRSRIRLHLDVGWAGSGAQQEALQDHLVEQAYRLDAVMRPRLEKMDG